MKKTNEVNYKELKFTCNPDVFKFETTADYESNYKGLGQARGIAALEFGLSVDIKGYNVYLEGPTGSGKIKKHHKIGVIYIILKIPMNQ